MTEEIHEHGRWQIQDESHPEPIEGELENLINDLLQEAKDRLVAGGHIDAETTVFVGITAMANVKDGRDCGVGGLGYWDGQMLMADLLTHAGIGLNSYGKDIKIVPLKEDD